MFTHFKNIDTAFRHVKTFSIVLLIVCGLISSFSVWKSYQAAEKAQGRIYVLANGKAFEALATSRNGNLPVELRDHIRTFHEYFFTLSPDDKAIQDNITSALYLADESAKHEYQNLKENGYYSNLISANISQEILIDSIQLDSKQEPAFFKCFATQKLVRATSTVTRKLITQGYVRDVKSQSDNNPHGFLIQKWEILDNSDVKEK